MVAVEMVVVAMVDGEQEQQEVMDDPGVVDE